MLYNLNWLATGQSYPPACERERIDRYIQNERLFGNEHFGGAPYHNTLYSECVNRLCDSIDGFRDSVCFPVILNYQRAVSLKTADLVCGEAPDITESTTEMSDKISKICESTEFNSKLYATVIDLSRYGDAVWRVFKNEETGKGDFTLWTPQEWYPILYDDGTLRTKCHVICWVTNEGSADAPRYRLHAQIHYAGYYDYKKFMIDGHRGTIGALVENKRGIRTGLKANAVIHVRNFRTSSTVYGFDDYMPLDSLLSEILTRLGQISRILDKHADPSMTGPASLLTKDEKTGRQYLKKGKFYAVGAQEEQPKYLTWDGQLEASFKQLEMLLAQLYMLSELGEALLGSMGASNGQAISGSAMRFKLANPLIKARRVANAMSLPAKKLIASMAELWGVSTDPANISIDWDDGLPNDDRENAEIASMLTGATQLMPIEEAISVYFDKSPKEAADWVARIEAQEAAKVRSDPNGNPGPNTVPDISTNSRSVGSGKSGSIMNP